MKIVMFYHSLVSDWNHGNAHFLRGVTAELLFRGHDVRVYEPREAWSAQNLRAEHGDEPFAAFEAAYPTLAGVSESYDPATLDLDVALADADLVIVHEWSDHALVHHIGQHRAAGRRYRLLFHDTHHRAVTDPAAMAAYDLSHFDGVLAYGEVLRTLYLANGWTRRAWTWHEAADTRVFRPLAGRPAEGDLVWVGNWGDDERTAELQEFLLDPVKSLGLKARVHGVRYPDAAKAALAEAGIGYAGWLANFAAPEAFARFRVTVHVPRRPYVAALRGIPTIRPFEALACGIPLVCSPWDDAEGLFTPGKDYLVARSGAEMRQHLHDLLADPEYARRLAADGHRTLLSRHTCAHRVDELMEVVAELANGGGNGVTSARRPTTVPAVRELAGSRN
ncbi:MAG: a-glycosyltransferase, Glycosyltransferase Family 4-like protein [Phycisphaerales bacterium]|nr:a-glycosyltransferase, Glycosyltransferase Family 4-like protein [Phycisphaerales bacterium]